LRAAAVSHDPAGRARTPRPGAIVTCRSLMTQMPGHPDPAAGGRVRRHHGIR
jgi:hypothetical protein